ncbi:P-loop containing nucleoside triphosphate hydrolase protein [Xylaria acuta]|nr:P-loop containing nucleoside triphosphate hydrolase protein [Xylaria acuta]
MEAHERQGEASGYVSRSYDDITHSNLKGTTTTKTPKPPKPIRIKLSTKSAGRDSIVGKKRKSDGPILPTKAEQNKRQKPGPRNFNARKAKLENQLGNMIELGSRQQDQSSDTPEYTPEQRKRENAELEEAVLVFGSKIQRKGQELGLPNELFLVDGMLNTIRDYQVVGAAFMLRQERRKAKGTLESDKTVNQSTNQTEKARNGCRGGILADEMGLGKTVQTIACMLAHPPSMKAKQALQAATLIIVPNQGLVKQWTEELWLHAKIPEDEVCKYTGGMKPLGIKAYPYVLATYSQVERDFRLYSSDKKESSGPLFQVEFYRIVLDEGDNIKNSQGSTSKACCELKAQLKWVLSGTPLRNGLKECLPYFRFLGIDVNEKWEEFVKKWMAPKSKKLDDRTMQILAHIMLRRHLEEAMIRLEEEARQKAKEAKEAGQKPEDGEPDLDGPKSNYRVRCTRLRQAVDHPFLLEKCIRDILNRDELKNLIAELRKIESSKTKVKNETSSLDGLPSAQPEESSIYKLAVYIISHLDDILSSHDNDGCLECFSVFELQSLDCEHVMCRNCYQNHIVDSSAENNKQCKCPQCGKVFAVVKGDPDNKQLAREGPEKIKSESIRTPDGRSLSIIPTHERTQRSPGDDYNGMQPQMSPSCCRWLRKCDKLGTITPSTKTTTAIDIVEGWQKEAPGDKIVIFTEWIGTAKILGRMLNRANIEFVYYSGHIPVKDRDKNLKDFKSNSNIKVMVSTMAAGNVGLNIIVANRMIIMNPWWNYAAEAQAFGRLKRHGQTKKTYMVRLFAKGTIDERILKLQKQKISEIKEAMSQGRKPKPLSQAERQWLMGNRDALESPFDESDDETLVADDSDSSD